jgi:tetratricopeptide (TPR) repeat protein
MWFVPFFSALLFLVHPINTESVTYIIQRYTSLGAFFYLLTMLLFLKSLLSSITWQQWVLCAGSVFSLVIGMLSQEGLITAPFVLVLMGTVLLQMPLRTVCARASVHFFCLPIIPTVVYLITAAQSEKINRIIDGYPPYEYAITQTRVILTYLRMLIAPYGQNIDPTYPLYRSIAEPEVVISIAVLFLFLIAGVVLLYRKQRSSYTDLLGFCIFFSFFAICVSSSIFPLPDLMAEHRSYLFSLPVITGLVCLVESIRTQLSSKWRIAVITFLGILVVLYATLTVSRNHLYATQSSMWEDAVSKSPDKWRPHYNAGNAYVDEHEYGKALYYYQRAIQINPYKIQSYSNLGSTYMLLSNYHAAIETYRNGLAVSGDNPILLINLGIAYRQAGQLQDAIEVTESSINSNPDVFAAYKLLAELYAATGDNGKSMSYIRKARALNGQDSELNLLEDKIRK